MVSGEHSLKILAQRFGIYDVVNIWRKRASQLMNHEAVYRTAPATPGMLKIVRKDLLSLNSPFLGLLFGLYDELVELFLLTFHFALTHNFFLTYCTFKNSCIVRFLSVGVELPPLPERGPTNSAQERVVFHVKVNA